MDQAIRATSDDRAGGTLQLGSTEDLFKESLHLLADACVANRYSLGALRVLVSKLMLSLIDQ